ncbi:BPI fold-containing family C protein-like [Rana temporaria]|uniref:BPI fold-containing family C protein-like n=1 Tax=Rana temporaria TaxID=8407 RepID=UPI001AAD8EF2|nr:BPI fold-containing family C protein-like [Rana temporaria]
MLLAGSVLFIVLSISATCNANNPGIKVRMTEDVLEKGVKYLIDTMTAEISSYNLPDVNGSATIESDEMLYQLTKIQIVNFNFENVSSKFVPGIGAQISLHRGNAAINCQCDINSWLITDSASALLTLKEISIVMILGIRRIDPGVPSLFMSDCQSTIQNIDFKMFSEISYVYEALKSHIEEVLQRSVSEQLCSAVRSQVVAWDVSFSDLQMNVTLSRNIDADLSLTNDPEISEKYAVLNFKGQFHEPNVTTVEYSPAPFTLPAMDSSRSCAGISEASFNSLVNTYYSSGSMNAMLFSTSRSIKLTTSELTDAVPEISEYFKSPTPAKIILYATSCPNITLKDKNIIMDFQGLFQIHVKPAEGKSQVLLEANILAVLNGEITMSDAEKFPGLNVSASVSLNRLQIDKIEPNSKGKKAASEKGIQHIFNQMLLPKINEKLKQGIPVPTKILKNPSSFSKQGYELVEINFILV